MTQQDTQCIAELLPQIAWTARPDGAIDYLNRRWSVYAGDRIDGLGWSWQELVPPDDRQQVIAQWQRGISAGTSFELECCLRRADGACRRHLFRGDPLRGGNGVISKWFGTATDIEDRKCAEEAGKAKDQFLAMLSHELRTPLTPVLAAVTGLRLQHRWPGELREELEIIRRSVELEARLIDDLLDLTGIMRGTLRLNRETVDVHSILRAATEVSAEEIAGKSLELQIGAEAEAHHTEGDPARLQQVFWNLIRNAVKFTSERGRITIRTWNGARPGSFDPGADAWSSRKGPHPSPLPEYRERRPEESRKTPGAKPGDGERGLIIEVADTGIGIARELLPRVFQAFEQGRDANNQRFTGLGMGLAITKALVEMHGGQIGVASDGPGRGAIFTVWLPCRQLATTGDVHEAAKPVSPARSLRILLVEDHENSRRVLERLLRSSNYEVTAAWDMGTALKAAAERQFDLLISDLGLPDGNGLDLMRQLRARRPVRGICLSGFGTEEDMRHSREAGFASHLVKPISFQTLQATIRRVVG